VEHFIVQFIYPKKKYYIFHALLIFYRYICTYIKGTKTVPTFFNIVPILAKKKQNIITMNLFIVEKGYNQITGAVTYKPTGFLYNTITGTSTQTNLTFPTKTKANEDSFMIVGSPSNAVFGNITGVTLDGVADVAIKVDDTVVIVTSATIVEVELNINQRIALLGVGKRGSISLFTNGGNDVGGSVVANFPIVIEIGGKGVTY